MKRIGQIYDRIWNYENLVAAYVAVRRGHSRNKAVMAFGRALGDNLREISFALRAEQPRFGNYHFFQIYDPKERTICAASVRERVIHHAVIQVCGEWMERSLTADCFACRKGYGQFKALDRAQQYLRTTPWFLKMDVRKYFDSVRHDVLLGILVRKFKDRRLLALFEELLDSYHTEPGCGLPIGNLSSQYFANLYLDGFDHFAREQCKLPGYVRYMDDMLAFGERDQLRQFREQAQQWLNAERGLVLKQEGGYLNRCQHGVEFLGFRARGNQLRLNRRSMRRFITKLKNYDNALNSGAMSEDAYQQRSTALFSFVCHADTLALRRKILGAGQRLQPGETGRLLEQQRDQLHRLEPQQQQPDEPQQQQRLSSGCLGSTMRTIGRRSSSRPASRSCSGTTNIPSGAGLVAQPNHGEGPATAIFDF